MRRDKNRVTALGVLAQRNETDRNSRLAHDTGHLYLIGGSTMSVKELISQRIETYLNRDEARYHLGMSEIGHPCERYLWYSFRHARPSTFDTRILLKFADGHRCEDAMATMIGVEGRQERRELFGGWFGGSIDGMIDGKIWEHKASDKLEEFRKAKTLKAWNPRYYAQAVMYMHSFDVPGHVITVSNHGLTDWDCKETEPNPGYAEELIEKARRVIFNDAPPPSADLWDCKWCNMQGLCKGSELAVKNCRTCNNWSPRRYGKAHCAIYDVDLDVNELHNGLGEDACKLHVFNPNCVPGELTADGTYLLRNGERYADLHF